MPRNRENTHLAAPARKPKTDGRHATLTPRILGSPSRGDCTSGRKLVPEFRGHFQIAEGFVPIWTNRCRANRLFYITLGLVLNSGGERTFQQPNASHSTCAPRKTLAATYSPLRILTATSSYSPTVAMFSIAGYASSNIAPNAPNKGHESIRLT